MGTTPECPAIAPRLVVEYDLQEPPDLDTMATALTAVAAEYRMMSGERLFLCDVRHRSPWYFELAPLVVLAAGNLQQAEQIIATMKGFLGHLGGMKEWMRDLTAMPTNLATVAKVSRSIGNLKDICDPVKREAEGALSVNIHNENCTIVDSFKVDYSQAREVASGIDRYRELMSQRLTVPYTNVSLRWYQARNDPNATTGNLAVVETICEKPIKTVFGSDIARVEMLRQPGANPFRSVFKVDLDAVVGVDRPSQYIIQAVHSQQADES